MRKLGILLLFAVAGVGACQEFPTKPLNRNPSINSVTAFPTRIGQGDSLLVTVLASDPDGDTLVYDWYTDGRMRIKDAHLGIYRFNTLDPTQVFYRSTSVPVDSVAYISCYVRDGRGGVAGWPTILIALED